MERITFFILLTLIIEPICAQDKQHECGIADNLYSNFQGQKDSLINDTTLVFTYDCCSISITPKLKEYNFIFQNGFITPQMIYAHYDVNPHCNCSDSIMPLENIIYVTEIENQKCAEEETFGYNLRFEFNVLGLNGQHYYLELNSSKNEVNCLQYSWSEL